MAGLQLLAFLRHSEKNNKGHGGGGGGGKITLPPPPRVGLKMNL